MQEKDPLIWREARTTMGALSDARLYPQVRRRLNGLVVLLLGLTAFYPLVACNSFVNAPASAPKTEVATATPQTQALTRKLVWSDEFDGASGTPPDPSKWSPRVGGGGWGNKQLDYDTDNHNIYQDGQGNLVIEARKGSVQGAQCWYGPCQYTSAQISTNGHFSFTYGLLEARMKIPYGQGLWTAFWMLGNNCDTVGWPACGEIDVMENVGFEPGIAHATLHGPGDYTGPYHLSSGALSGSFHTYGMLWDPDHIYFLLDGMTYYILDRATLKNQGDWVYNHPFYILLNVAVGGTWPGSPNASTTFPQKLYVSYVRLYTI